MIRFMDLILKFIASKNALAHITGGACREKYIVIILVLPQHNAYDLVTTAIDSYTSYVIFLNFLKHVIFS